MKTWSPWAVWAVAILSAPFAFGCIFLALGGAAYAILASQNMDPIAFQGGWAIRDYAVSMDRGWAAVESALRGAECRMQPASHGATAKSIAGETKDGLAIQARASQQGALVRVEVKVGDREDTDENRKIARDIHARIDADFQIVRRHYPKSFSSVYEASQKVEVKEARKFDPGDEKLAQISGKRADGTQVVITIQKVDDNRTRITVEVGTQADEKTKKEALDIAQQISEALGVKPEEEQPK
jgi:hypothetical protein